MNDPASNDQQKSATESLSTLHKMSRTAGVGTQEYVAVNVTSVVALLLGLASAAAMLNNILLVIPLATLIVSVIAILQIRNSAGTQTGKGLALLGLLLAGIFVVVVGGQAALHARQISAERDQIVSLIDQVGKDVSAANYNAAWAQFSPRFKERIKRETFDSVWSLNQANPSYGHIKLIRWNGILDVQIDPETGNTTAEGLIVIELDSNQYDRRRAVFRKVAGQGWAVEDIDGYFPQPPAANRPN